MSLMISLKDKLFGAKQDRLDCPFCTPFPPSSTNTLTLRLTLDYPPLTHPCHLQLQLASDRPQRHQI
ncbi:Uncharacterized protein HZ326_19516 [Fusarium oxysporum f. sp. albedinis]|nr:Uncharacterized protein HZ326_19516 [Fusarium oxysporum f. sp. albedinis]